MCWTARACFHAEAPLSFVNPHQRVPPHGEMHQLEWWLQDLDREWWGPCCKPGTRNRNDQGFNGTACHGSLPQISRPLLTGCEARVSLSTRDFVTLEHGLNCSGPVSATSQAMQRDWDERLAAGLVKPGWTEPKEQGSVKACYEPSGRRFVPPAPRAGFPGQKGTAISRIRPPQPY